MNVSGKTVWITGASSGIGEALAYALSRRGARLILSARRAERLRAVKAACAGPEAHHVVPLDLADPASLTGAAARVLETLGPVDVLVNNGGISQRALVEAVDVDVIRRIMEVNFFGAVGLTKAVLPSMLERGAGHVVVVSSLVGKFSTPRRSAYAASKHALHGFFDALRAEVWDRGVHVTIVCPGYVRTEISRNALAADGTTHGRMDAGQKKGIAPERCAEAIIRAVEKDRDEVLVGGKETLAVYVRRFFPGLFNRVIRTAKVT
jgi:short-subunit dehydrogenase